MVAMQVTSNMTLKNSGTPDPENREDKQPRPCRKPDQKKIKTPTWSMVKSNKKTFIISWILCHGWILCRREAFPCGWSVLAIPFQYDNMDTVLIPQNYGSANTGSLPNSFQEFHIMGISTLFSAWLQLASRYTSF